MNELHVTKGYSEVTELMNVHKSTVVQAKMGHASPMTPILGVICHFFGKTLDIVAQYKI